MFNRKIKSITAYTMYAVMVMSVASTPARAGVQSEMADMFNGMGANTNYTSAGAYHSQSANVYTGGSFSMRAPVKSLYPMQIQLPSASAGCGGIDFFSGAFSFANKEQFIEFTRNLGNNAAGVAFEIGLDALDPLISGSIAKIRGVVNLINQNGLNSCQAAKAMVGGMAGKIGESITKECELTSNEDGTVSDAAESRWYCKSKARLLNQRTKKLTEATGDFYNSLPVWITGNNATNGVRAPQGTGVVNKFSLAMTGGNLTLMALNKFSIDNEQKSWLMSIMGVQIVDPPPKNSSDENVIPHINTLPPTISGDRTDALTDFFGADAKSDVKVKLYECHAPGATGMATDPYKATECSEVEHTYTGFRTKVAQQVQILKDNVISGTRLSNTDREMTIKIINNTSYPLLKMAIVDAQGGTALADKAVDAITLDFTYRYLAAMQKAGKAAIAAYETKDPSEEHLAVNALDNLNRLLTNLKVELDAANLKVSSEKDFGEYVQKINQTVAASNPSIASAVSFSKIVGGK